MLMADFVEALTKSLGGLSKGYFEINTVSIDNWVFKLFYKVTTTILVFSSILVTSRQFFGEPIQCDAGASSGSVEKSTLQTYCWMYAKFHIPAKYQGPCSTSDEDLSEDIETNVYNSYYQWVPLYLVFLAALFYLPRIIWLVMEGGLMKFFAKGTTTRIIEDQDEKREKLVEFFRRNIQNKYNIYLVGFICCEFLNIIIVLLQFPMTNKFLRQRYSTYGFDVWQYYQLPVDEQKLDTVKNPMCQAFPRVASCKYFRYGTAGGQEDINALCILALNIINDKVFLILWWWFNFIAIVGISRLIYRALQMSIPALRYKLFDIRLNRYFKQSNKIAKIEEYISNAKLGDWFVLYQLSKNLNRPFFIDFLTDLSVKPQEEDPEDRDDCGIHWQMKALLKPSNTNYQDKIPFIDDSQPDGINSSRT